ncbi:RNA polymerase factor sigma-32 [Maritimibacter sp. 55A14]|uniref:RNA polymerase factor sigma-32 n=1 Tax=Maritimibacter sp. 55A14 TaxID=2174844 RepID=UPI000D61EFB2|nr:RNA polymerase factor sigma-32 [Maritimibacter sp. 55A14]PWE34394.1 RNA polymerase factor sigma-32 [Maritimibacter sp. 55A14]
MNMHVSADRDFRKQAMATEMLDAETEQRLARAWRDEHDEAALHRLINAYGRLAVSLARGFRRYGLSQEDLLQQANLGLLKAAEKFDPDHGARFSTYASWWVKASIRDYVLRNWSIVRTGTTAPQKSIFFNLGRVRAQIERRAADDPDSPAARDPVGAIARELNVPEEQVRDMLGRMSGPDMSLNAPQRADEDGREWLDLLEDETPLGADEVMERSHRARLHDALEDALGTLPERERSIVVARRLTEDPPTLSELGVQMGVSKERIRQLEERGLERLTDAMRAALPAEARKVGAG